jgi:quercetin dioxygenase-like cupin family protein
MPIQVTRIKDAKPYAAKNHFGMQAFRLHGLDASDCKDFWVGLSTFLPGGGAEKGAAPTGKVYMVIEGEITVTTAEGDITLGPLDSCYIPPNTERSVENKSNHPTRMFVVSPP